MLPKAVHALSYEGSCACAHCSGAAWGGNLDCVRSGDGSSQGPSAGHSYLPIGVPLQWEPLSQCFARHDHMEALMDKMQL